MMKIPLIAVALASPAIALALVVVAGIFSDSAAQDADKVLVRLVPILRAWRNSWSPCASVRAGSGI